MFLVCWLLVPLLTALLLWALRPHEDVSFTLGTTRFADPEMYEQDGELTTANCREYLRDGATVVRGALQPEVVAAIYDEFVRKYELSDHAYVNGLWMESDVFRDIFIYSKLGALAAAVYGCEGAETAGEVPSARLYRAHIGGRRSGWHYDTSDCQDGDLPANYTARSLPRMVLPLLPLERRGETLMGTTLYNQSVYASAMPPPERERYWRGELPYRVLEEKFDYASVSELPPLATLPGGHEPQRGGLIEPQMAFGDVMIMSSCIIHRAPMPFSTGVTLALTFAPGSALLNKRYGRGMGDCRHGQAPGDPMSGGCFPHAWPSGARPLRGQQVSLERVRLAPII